MSLASQDLAEVRAARLEREAEERENTHQARYELSLAGLGTHLIDDVLTRARRDEHGLASAISPTTGRVWVQYAGNGVFGIIRSHRAD